MSAKQLLLLASAMGMPDPLRMHRENQEAKRRHWHQVGSKCSHCKKLCDPQEVFYSPQCKGEYLADKSVDDLLKEKNG